MKTIMKLKTSSIYVLLSTVLILSSCSRVYHSRSYVKTPSVAKEQPKSKAHPKTEVYQLSNKEFNVGMNPIQSDVPVNTLNVPVTAFNSIKKKENRPTENTTQVVTPFKKGIESQIQEEVIKPKKQNQEQNQEQTKEERGKDQLVAFLLCLFVGSLGIHRFYLGYYRIGILQLITLGGFGIWTIIDLILLFTGDLQPKNGYYYRIIFNFYE